MEEFIQTSASDKNATVSDLMMLDLLKSIDKEEMEELGVPADTQTFQISNRVQAETFVRRVKELMEENENVETTAKEALERYTSKVEN